MFYVIELQSGAASGAVLPYSYTERENAEAQYHSLLSVAAKSSVLNHTVMLVMENGNVIKSETYYHGGEA